MERVWDQQRASERASTDRPGSAMEKRTVWMHGKGGNGGYGSKGECKQKYGGRGWEDFGGYHQTIAGLSRLAMFAKRRVEAAEGGARPGLCLCLCLCSASASTGAPGHLVDPCRHRLERVHMQQASILLHTHTYYYIHIQTTLHHATCHAHAHAHRQTATTAPYTHTHTLCAPPPSPQRVSTPVADMMHAHCPSACPQPQPCEALT